jgi:serine/threonine-protein kinase RsbW
MFPLECVRICGQPLAASMKREKLEFSSHTANLGLMREFVRKFLDGYNFSKKERLLMVLGVDEACTNIIRYAYDLRDDQPITLWMEGLRRCVRIRLRDYGAQGSVREVEERANGEVKPGGLGLYLISAAFDQVDYILKARGTELILTKNLE